MKKVVAILLLVFLALSLPGIASAEDGPCEKGLFKCMLVTAAALGAPLVSLSMATFCVNGYVWCKNYYPE